MASALEKFTKLLFDLLPIGEAWNDEPDSTMRDLVTGMATEFCRVNDKFEDFINQLDPQTTVELLEDWETFLGLPDPCLENEGLTDAERRDQIVTKLRAVGGQSRQYFIDLAASLGFDIEIFEAFPLRANIMRSGDRLGGTLYEYRASSARASDRLGPNDERFNWVVKAPEVPVRLFRAGEARAGDRLGDFGNEVLECVIRRYKPAHTGVFFIYG